MEILNSPTRNLFFTGKGGVGKTSLSCAVAIALADAGKRVLLVSTDPASNLDEVLGVTLEQEPTSVPDVAGLMAMNIDPEAAARAYRERMVGPYRDVLPATVIDSMEEQLSGSCTVEIAAFDEFAKLLGDPATTAQFDHVIFDTAPTGHTLRLLTLPSAWSEFLDTNTTGTSCLGPLGGLEAQQELYRRTVQSLGDPATTTLMLVARADGAALQEAARTSRELNALGVRNQHLLINGVFHTDEPDDAVAQSLQRRGELAMAALPESLQSLPRSVVPLAPFALLGISALRAMTQPNREAGWAPSAAADDATKGLQLETLNRLVDELARAGQGVVLTMGKGGVGKTTVAAAVAVALAERGFPVYLSTTDPAAHVAATINGSLPNLQVSRIDPQVETAAYAREVMATAGATLDEHGQALLEEDLHSPCTEEIAVFRAFAAAVDRGQDGFVVLDTAPTGHTILLLDTALAFHRELSRQSSDLPTSVQQLLPRLRDRQYTHVLIVTLPEATPVHEAAQLQHDLRRAGIEPFAWVINQSLYPLNVSDRVLAARRQQERRFLHEVAAQHALRVAIVPWQSEPPVGQARLRALAHEPPARRHGPSHDQRSTAVRRPTMQDE